MLIWAVITRANKAKTRETFCPKKKFYCDENKIVKFVKKHLWFAANEAFYNVMLRRCHRKCFGRFGGCGHVAPIKMESEFLSGDSRVLCKFWNSFLEQFRIREKRFQLLFVNEKKCRKPLHFLRLQLQVRVIETAANFVHSPLNNFVIVIVNYFNHDRKWTAITFAA